MMQILQDPKFWVAIATLTFVVIVFKPVRLSMLNMLDSKIDKVKRELDEARRLKEEAQNILAEAEKRLAKSEEESKLIIEYARSQSEEIIRKTKQKLASDIENKKKMVLSKIRSVEESALEDIKRNISTMTILAAHTILEENLNDELARRLSEESAEKILRTVH